MCIAHMTGIKHFPIYAPRGQGGDMTEYQGAAYDAPAIRVI